MPRIGDHSRWRRAADHSLRIGIDGAAQPQFRRNYRLQRVADITRPDRTPANIVFAAESRDLVPLRGNAAPRILRRTAERRKMQSGAQRIVFTRSFDELVFE